MQAHRLTSIAQKHTLRGPGIADWRSVDTSQLKVATGPSPAVMGEAQKEIGKQVVQLFYTNLCGFLL
jgi:hypothetical protein